MSTNYADILRILSQGQGPQTTALPGGLGNPEIQQPSTLPAQDLIASPDPANPRPPDVQMEGMRRMLTDFTYSLGMGLEASSQGARGRGLRTTAGMGAILKVPEQLQAAREKARLDMATEQQRLAAARASEANATKTSLMLPAQIQALMAGTNKTNVQANDIPQARSTANESAATAATRAKYISTPQGLMDVSTPTPTVVPGSAPIEFTVTPDIAEKFGVPELSGAKVPTSTFNEIIKGKNPKLQLTPIQEAEGKLGLYSVNLETGEKIRVGDAKTGLLDPAVEAQKIRIAKAAADNRQPTVDPSDVKWIADQVDEDSTGTMMTKLVGTNQKLKQQVTHELATRDADLHILTAATRQLGETAHELMPNFDHVQELLTDNGVKQALGPLGSRWQEFLAGKIGTSDPAFRGLAPQTIGKMNDLRTFVSLLQTGTMRAHIGARGNTALQQKFENLFNADKMDASTLKDTLGSARSFLKTYENAVYGPGNANPSGTSTLMVGPDGKQWQVPPDKVSIFEQNGYKRK